MSEKLSLPPPDDAPEPVIPPPKAPDRSVAPWLYGLGLLVLAAAIIYVWQSPRTPNETIGNTQAITAIEHRLADIDARLVRVEQRPGPDLGKITARLDSLDGRIVDQAQLASRVDILSGRIESLSGRDQTGLDAAKQQIDALSGRLSAIEAATGGLDAVEKRLNRIAKLQDASFALASGRPIGDLANAPAALARYAHAAPPTEAQLRIRFPRAEQAALSVKPPDQTEAPFVDRVLDRAQSLLTIRRGDDVVVGNPVAMTLNHAQAALDAGDIAGAVTEVETLTGQPAQAMASWLADAKALLDARSALAKMADQA